MNINTAEVIIGADGDPLVQQQIKKDPKTGKYETEWVEVTLRWVIQHVCNAQIEGVPHDAESLVKCGTLASRAYEDNPDFTDKERSYILSRAEHLLAPSVYCALMDAFDSDRVLRHATNA